MKRTSVCLQFKITTDILQKVLQIGSPHNGRDVAATFACGYFRGDTNVNLHRTSMTEDKDAIN